jgi:hypothetical protein
VSTIPSYLLLSRHSVYYFRIVVPDVIRPLFPQREIRRSLQTRCKREALIRGRDILAFRMRSGRAIAVAIRLKVYVCV